MPPENRSPMPNQRTIAVELAASLAPLVTSPEELARQLEPQITALMARFGVPGEARVTVDSRDAELPVVDPLVRITVDGRPARYPDVVIAGCHAYVTGRHVEPGMTRAVLGARLAERLTDSSGHDEVTRTLVMSCVEILARQPAALSSQAREISGDASWLPAAVSDVLDAGVSLADPRAAALLHGVPDGSRVAAVESLLDVLVRETIDIEMSEPFMRALTSAWPPTGTDLLAYLRDGIFEELGLVSPPLHFVIADDLSADTFRLRVNDLRSLPMRALEPNEILVNDTVERITASGHRARPVASPAGGFPNAIVDASAEGELRSTGLVTWNPIQHLGLCAAAFVRQHGWRTIRCRDVGVRLNALSRTHPALAAAVRAHYPDAVTTHVLRMLVRQQVSIRNLPGVLNCLLDGDAPEASASSRHWDDAALRRLVSQVREGMSREVAAKAARQSTVLVAYLVDAAIAERTAAAELSVSDGDAILRAFRSEVESLPPTLWLPNLLTGAASRAQLSALLRSEFPQVSVLAHEELPPGINVQPVARINVDEWQ